MRHFASDTSYSSLESYAFAQAALERIEERRRLSPVGGPWKIRMKIAERQALARMDGHDLSGSDFQVRGTGRVSASEYDVTSWADAIGNSISLDQLITDSIAVMAWLGIPETMGGFSAIPDAVARWQAEIANLPYAPPLLQSARIALLWRKHLPLGRGDLLASLLIGDRWGPGRYDGSIGGLTALGLEAEQTHWRLANGAAFDQIWLSAIRRGASLHLDQELRLRSYAQRAHYIVDQERRPGKLGALISLAMARPRITSSIVARELDVTPAGAIKLLTRAEERGLLIEQTGYSAYRSYSIPVAFMADRKIASEQ